MSSANIFLGGLPSSTLTWPILTSDQRMISLDGSCSQTVFRADGWSHLNLSGNRIYPCSCQLRISFKKRMSENDQLFLNSKIWGMASVCPLSTFSNTGFWGRPFSSCCLATRLHFLGGQPNPVPLTWLPGKISAVTEEGLPNVNGLKSCGYIECIFGKKRSRGSRSRRLRSHAETLGCFKTTLAITQHKGSVRTVRVRHSQNERYL